MTRFARWRWPMRNAGVLLPLPQPSEPCSFNASSPLESQKGRCAGPGEERVVHALDGSGKISRHPSGNTKTLQSRVILQLDRQCLYQPHRDQHRSVEPQLYRRAKKGNSPSSTAIAARPAQSAQRHAIGKRIPRVADELSLRRREHIHLRQRHERREEQQAADRTATAQSRPSQSRTGIGMFPLYYEYRPNKDQSPIRYPVNQVTGQSAILQLKTFNPLSPWTGIAPMMAAAFGIDIFNSGNKWNKRLLDNDARPSGALIVNGPDGNRPRSPTSNTNA